MRYVSTRGDGSSTGSFIEVMLGGLARDGGLWVPEIKPAHFSNVQLDELRNLSYQEFAVRILQLFIGNDIELHVLQNVVHEAYKDFDNSKIVTFQELEKNFWIMELFHGPTLAFKDYALQILGGLFNHVLSKENKQTVIVGATSGDTGSAAIEAFKGYATISTIILHPKGRVSEVQRRQMTTVEAQNVYNVAINGTFDDCQALVKGMFNDLQFRDELHLAAINSINWARIVSQAVYYGYASLRLGNPNRPINFSVPTGNFGNVYSGYIATMLGFPIEKFYVATNANDILARVFSGDGYYKNEVIPTISPSMDIQIASNFERLLFELYGRNGDSIKSLFQSLDSDNGFTIGQKQLNIAWQMFSAISINDDRALKCISRVWKKYGVLIDPHTAVGVQGARDILKMNDNSSSRLPMVCLATAHPAKFPEAVHGSTGVKPPLPERLSDLLHLKENINYLENDLCAVKNFDREVGLTKQRDI